jgi:hypothetical protein
VAVAPSPSQLVWRRRIEAGLRLAEPGLNLLLFVADRVSRAVDREDTDAYVPPRRSDGSLPSRVQATGSRPPAGS